MGGRRLPRLLLRCANMCGRVSLPLISLVRLLPWSGGPLVHRWKYVAMGNGSANIRWSIRSEVRDSEESQAGIPAIPADS